MKKVTPEILAFVINETELIYIDNSYTKLIKIFRHFKAGKLYYEKRGEGYELIYKKLMK